MPIDRSRLDAALAAISAGLEQARADDAVIDLPDDPAYALPSTVADQNRLPRPDPPNRRSVPAVGAGQGEVGADRRPVGNGIGSEEERVGH